MPSKKKIANDKLKTVEKLPEVSKRKIIVTKRHLLLGALLVVLVFLGMRFKGLLIAATVNGQPITRLALLQELEREGGKQVLDNLITNSLILQEASREKVTVTQAEVDTQMATIENNLKTSGQSLESALAMQGMTRKDLEVQVKTQLLVQKMAGKDITITDQEVADYFKQNQSTYPKGTKIESVSDQIRTTLQSQKMSQATATWVSNLRSKAKINYWVSF